MAARYVLRKHPKSEGVFQLLDGRIIILEASTKEVNGTYPLFYREGLSLSLPDLFGIAKDKEEAERRLYDYARRIAVVELNNFRNELKVMGTLKRNEDFREGDYLDDQTGLAAKVNEAVPA